MIRFAALNGSNRHAALRASLAYRSGSLSSRGEEQLRPPRSTPSTLCGLHPSKGGDKFHVLFAHPEVAPPWPETFGRRGRSNRHPGVENQSICHVNANEMNGGSLTRSVLRYCTVQLSPSVRQLSKKVPPRRPREHATEMRR